MAYLYLSDAQDPQKCFATVKLYLILISMPGSMAFRIFHCVANKFRQTCAPAPTKQRQRQAVLEIEEDDV